MKTRRKHLSGFCLILLLIILLVSCGSDPQNTYDEALYHYERFLQGEESAKNGQETVDIDFITKPTGEPEKHYFSEYAFWDSDMDGEQELHVKSARYYYIIKYDDSKLVVWKELSRDYEPLSNGAFLETRVFSVPTYEAYTYVIAAPDGSNEWEISFSVYDANGNGINDEKDGYCFDDVEVAKEQWEALTERYLTIGSDEIEWQTIYAETD